jgi:hypothetical protein
VRLGHWDKCLVSAAEILIVAWPASTPWHSRPICTMVWCRRWRQLRG